MWPLCAGKGLTDGETPQNVLTLLLIERLYNNQQTWIDASFSLTFDLAFVTSQKRYPKSKIAQCLRQVSPGPWLTHLIWRSEFVKSSNRLLVKSLLLFKYHPIQAHQSWIFRTWYHITVWYYYNYLPIWPFNHFPIDEVWNFNLLDYPKSTLLTLWAGRHRGQVIKRRL